MWILNNLDKSFLKKIQKSLSIHCQISKWRFIAISNTEVLLFQDSDYFKKLQSRNNVILLGDSVGDLTMCNGLENPAVVLKIGFLNFKIDERLDDYLDLFDIVLLDDQTLNVPLSIVQKISTNWAWSFWCQLLKLPPFVKISFSNSKL